MTACMFVFRVISLLFIIIDDTPQGLSVCCLIIVFHVDGGVVFELSFLEAYDCWAVFCDK